MSRVVFWNETNIIGECIYDLKECRYKVNGTCFNNMSKNLGRKCHGCKDFTKEERKEKGIIKKPYIERSEIIDDI